MSDLNKHSDWGWGTDAYPAQEPQELQFQQDRQNASGMPTHVSESYVWVVSGREIAVVNPSAIESAYAAVGASVNHYGPLATGTVDVSHRWTASFVVKETNIDLDSLHKLFEKWAKDPVIDFEHVNHKLIVSSVVDKNGIPLPVKMRKQASDPGAGDGYVNKDWKNTDEDLMTDIQRDYPGQGDMRATDGQLTEYEYQCPECQEEFRSYNELREHMVFDHEKWDMTGPEAEIVDFGGIAEMERDNEAVTELDGGIHTGAVIDGPIAFAYDPSAERVYVYPGGEVKTDNPNPSMAEGYYTPDGDMLIIVHPQEMYAVSNLMGSWLQMYPDLEIKHIYLLREENGTRIKEKVANA